MKRIGLGRTLTPLVAAAIVIAWLVPCGTTIAIGQGADAASGHEATADRPRGLRLTPGMARGMAREFVKHNLRQRYELPEDREAEAVEMVARRVMEAAHAMDGPGQELIQRFAEEQLMNQIEGGSHGFMPPAFGQEFAERVKPMMPTVRDLVRNVAQDVRPMLPMKKQLQMAGELMAVKTTMDSFEQTMDKWASGEVKEFRDPFNQRNENIKKDENGVSEQLRRARESAVHAGQMEASEWEAYLKDAKQFYAFDDSQSATADSILREYKERAEALNRDQAQLNSLQNNRVWQMMIWSIPESWNHPLRTMLEDERELLTDDVTRLGEDFKTRLESIPTESQRRAAAERMTALLDEKGFGGVE